MCNNFFLSLECVPCNEVVTDRSGNAGKLLLLVKGVHVNNGVGRILVMNVRWVGSDVPQTGPDFPERTVMTLSRSFRVNPRFASLVRHPHPRSIKG